MNVVLFDIQRASFVDGPGIRTTVFFKGCNLRCAWCHNPESQQMAPQLMVYADKCVGCGKCAEVCPHHLKACDACGKCAEVCLHGARQLCGKVWDTEDIVAEIVKDKAFYETSGGGVTFSGGECMLQIEPLIELLRRCKEEGIHTAVDTAGAYPFEWLTRVMPHTDLFLYDVKGVDPRLHKEAVGVDGEQIRDNLRRLGEVFPGDILLRIPVIPGYNDSEEAMQNMAAFVRSVRHTGVELLPYHRMGEHKYTALGREFHAYETPTDEDMARYRALFAE